MERLWIRALGPLTIQLDDHTDAKFETEKAKALFLYLIMNRHRSFSRDYLAELLWPGSKGKSSLSSLRQTLTRLRKGLRSKERQVSIFIINRQSIQFNENCHFWLDVDKLEQLLSKSAKSDFEREESYRYIRRYKDAESLFRGTFFEDYSADELEFGGWLREQREKFETKRLQLLHRLTDYSTELSLFQGAQRYAQRQIKLAPFRENAYLQLFMSLLYQNERVKALKLYQKYEDLLQKELQIKPSRTFLNLVIQCRQGIQFKQDTIARRFVLPRLNTPFIGRLQEKSKLIKLLLEDSYSLVSLIGPGGIGKTRLAIEVAQELWMDFRHGVCFVSLLQIEDKPPASSEVRIEQILYTIVKALEMPFSEKVPLKKQLYQYIEKKEMLFVLDNIEQDIAHAEFFFELVKRAPLSVFLCTTRESLHAKQEFAFYLPGLSVECKGNDEVEELPESVALFVERTRSLGKDIKQTPQNLLRLTEMCRLADGLPLAIELLASWAHTYSLEEMIGLLQRDTSLLQTKLVDVPERHKSMHTVFSYSWEQLSRAQQTLLLQCTIFRGSFSSDDACSILQQTPQQLAQLFERSFLQQINFRWQIHPLLNKYLRELKARPESSKEEGLMLQAWEQVHERYVHHYIEFLIQESSELSQEGIGQAMERLQTEHDNIIHAWRLSLQLDTIHQTESLRSMFQYINLSFQLQVGEDIFTETLRHLKDKAPDHQSIAIVENIQAAIAIRQSRFQDSLSHAQNSLKEQKKHGDSIISARAESFLRMGTAYLHLGEKQKSFELLKQAEELQEYASHYIQTEIQKQLASHYWQQGEYQQAKALYEQSIELAQSNKNVFALGPLNNGLATILYYLGAHKAARTHYQKALEVSETTKNQYSKMFILMHLGVVETDQWNITEAHAHLQSSLEYARTLGMKRIMAASLSNLGRLYTRVGQFSKAEQCLQKAIAGFESIQYHRGLAYTYVKIALLKLEQQHLEEALTMALNGLRLAESIQEKSIMGQAYTAIGYIRTAEGEYKSANEQLLRAIELREKIGRKKLLAEPLVCLSWSAMQQNKPSDSYLERALELLQDSGAEQFHFWIRMNQYLHKLLLSRNPTQAEDVYLKTQAFLRDAYTDLQPVHWQEAFLQKVEPHQYFFN